MMERKFSNDLITNESPRIIEFFQSIDKLLDSVERMAKEQKPLFNGERYFTEKEVAEKLHISRRTLFEWRENGKLPYIKIGSKILYRQSDIQTSLEKQVHSAIKK